MVLTEYLATAFSEFLATAGVEIVATDALVRADLLPAQGHEPANGSVARSVGPPCVLFGFFPARRAASLNPIDALRYE